MSCCTGIRAQSVDHRLERDREWPPRPGRELPLRRGDQLRQLSRLLVRSPEAFDDWDRALRFYNPLAFTDEGCLAEGAPDSIYVPTREETRALRFNPPEDDEPVCIDEQLSQDVEDARPLRRDWSAFTADERDAAIRDFARRHGLDPEHVAFNPILGPQLQIHNVSLASSLVGLNDLPDDVTNEQLWNVITRQGGLGGFRVTEEMRQTPRYQELQRQEFHKIQLQQLSQNLPSITFGALGDAASLASNASNNRPTESDIMGLVIQRTDERLIYERALDQQNDP